MTYKYKKMKNSEDGSEQPNILAEKGKIIPKDPLNTDYIEYLEWVEAGNTPDEADQWKYPLQYYHQLKK